MTDQQTRVFPLEMSNPFIVDRIKSCRSAPTLGNHGQSVLKSGRKLHNHSVSETYSLG
jgi:hypothetical protein